AAHPSAGTPFAPLHARIQSGTHRVVYCARGGYPSHRTACDEPTRAQLFPARRRGRSRADARRPMLPPLLPAPKRAAARRGALRLRAGTPIALAEGSGDSELASAQALRDAVREACGLDLAIETHAHGADLGPRVELRCEGAAGESYRIAVDAGGAELAGAGPPGLRYAVETFAQLVGRGGRVA